MARVARRSNSRRTTSNSPAKRKTPSVAFTRSANDRANRTSNRIILDTNHKFEGYALFDPDPAAEDNPGYVEYAEHWDTVASRFVPCYGAKNGCIFCKAGLSPSQRALAAFLLVSEDGEELEEPEVKLFRMNWTMIQDWSDTLDEDGSTLGQKVRIKCVSREDGDFTTKFFEKDRLAKKDLAAAQEEIPDIEEQIQRQLDRALESMRVDNLLSDDDDDDDDDDDVVAEVDDDEVEEEEETPKKKPARRRTTRNKVVDDDDEEEVAEENDDEEEAEADENEDEADGDAEEESEEETDEDSGDGDSFDDTLTVVSANEAENTFTVKELDSDLYFSAEVIEDLDFDDYSKGDKIKVSAEKDDEGDWVAISLKKVKATGAKAKPAARATTTRKRSTTRR